MPEELTTKLEELSVLTVRLQELASAMNAANDAFRAALATHGIVTAEDYFSLIENKPLLQRLFDAEEDAFKSFAVLALAQCETVH
jgi:hypothetical protein